jgi:CRP-like cAMP-binding protein
MGENKVLIKSLTEVLQLNKEQINVFLAKCKDYTFNKGDYLQKEGQICNFLAFLEMGSLRYYTLADYDEMTLHFFTENQWITDYESLTTHTPTSNYIQVLEKTRIKIIKLDDIHLLLEQFPTLRNILKVLDKSIITSAHLTSITKASPDERYKRLLNTNPEWINRFPQMHIASYLGMTRETFSRVKARVK